MTAFAVGACGGFTSVGGGLAFTWQIPEPELAFWYPTLVDPSVVAALTC